MPKTRLNDPATSFEAAESVQHITETQKAILNLLRFPMTDSDLCHEYWIAWSKGAVPMASDSGIRSRRHELVELGLVVSCGVAKGLSGRNMHIWRVKDLVGAF
jgi:hypothetical protein